MCLSTVYPGASMLKFELGVITVRVSKFAEISSPKGKGRSNSSNNN